MPSNDDMARRSRLLSLILRHEPGKAGLELEPGGWVAVDDLLTGLAAMGRPMTDAELRETVETSDKKRFTLSGDGLRIRAAQGHSFQIELDLTATVPPDLLYHGTADRFLEAIMSEGLKRMSRLHVHLSLDTDTARNVGQRHGRPVVLTVASAEMHAGGHDFFVSDNGVWLTDNVPPAYLSLTEH